MSKSCWEFLLFGYYFPKVTLFCFKYYCWPVHSPKSRSEVKSNTWKSLLKWTEEFSSASTTKWILSMFWASFRSEDQGKTDWNHLRQREKVTLSHNLEKYDAWLLKYNEKTWSVLWCCRTWMCNFGCAVRSVGFPFPIHHSICDWITWKDKKGWNY